MGNHDIMELFIRTNSPTLAASAAIGAIMLSVAYVILWCGLNRGWGDERSFWIYALVVIGSVVMICPDCVFISGALFRQMFMGSLPAVGWLSFGALVLLLGVWIGSKQRKEAPPQTIRAQPEPRPAVTQEPRKPAVTAATSWPKPLPKAAPEPARLTRVETPPAVPLEYRREAMPVIRKPRR